MNPNAMNINYTTNSTRRYPDRTVTWSEVRNFPVVTREDLINSLKKVSGQYDEALRNYNDWGTAVGASVDKDMITKALSAPQNKGRLESEMSWAQALSGGLMQGFKSYNDAKAQQLASQKEQYDTAMKQMQTMDAWKAREEDAAMKKAELEKKTIEQTHYLPAESDGNGAMQQMNMYSAAADAIKKLNELSKGGIGGWNNEADSRWNSKTTANLLGEREAALSALIPITNAVAKASGGSGINTLGEMMAYLGVPENATSAQIAGALPGIIRKMPYEVKAQLPFTAEDLELALKGSGSSKSTKPGSGFSMDDLPVQKKSVYVNYDYGQTPQGYFGSSPYPYSPVPPYFYNK